MKATKDTYIAAYTLAPAQITGGWVATATERSFHAGLYGLGDTPELAVQALAGSIRDALRGPLAAQRGWAPDKFTRIMLMQATAFEMDALPEA